MRKVSIITPCYNSEKTIRKTIESVFNQTYPNIEYIIVDGKSSDSTVNIIREYMPLFSGRLKYVSEKDSGIYNAMNKGIKMATGDIIGILNSDDFYEKNAVEIIVKNMTNDDFQVLYGYCNFIKRSGSVRVLKESHKELNRRMIPHPTCFVTKKTYDKYGVFCEWFKICADYELMLRLKQKDVCFIQVEHILANFCDGGTSRQKKHIKRIAKERTIIWVKYGIVSRKEFIRFFLERYNNEQGELANKHLSMFKLMNRWVEVKQEGKSIALYLENREYHNIAIYGMSYIGERLCKELEKSKINIKYGIDKGAESVNSNFLVVSPSEKLEVVDAVIVTPIYYFDEIEKNLVEKLDCPILSLEDILYDL